MRLGAPSASLLSVAVMLGTSAVVAQRAPVAPLVSENATVKLGEHTHVIPDGNVPLVPNVGIVVGSRATLVIDPGLGWRNGETVLREVAKLSQKSELFVASTHFHAEHTTGYLSFPRAATYVNSNVQEAEAEEELSEQIWNVSARSSLAAALLSDAARREADVVFDRDYLLDLGGVRVRFVMVGPTHTRGDTGFFVEEDGVLFSGAVVMNNSFLEASGATSMTAWLAAFDTFQQLRPRTVVPAHGAVGDSSIIAICRTLMQDVQTRARELKDEGRSSDDVAMVVRMELVAKHPEWPRADGLTGAARAAYAEAP